jgi:hypothetical protein
MGVGNLRVSRSFVMGVWTFRLTRARLVAAGNGITQAPSVWLTPTVDEVEDRTAVMPPTGTPEVAPVAPPATDLAGVHHGGGPRNEEREADEFVRSAVSAAAGCIQGEGSNSGFALLASTYSQLLTLLPTAIAARDAYARSVATGFVAASLMCAAPLIVAMPEFKSQVDVGQRGDRKLLSGWTRVRS